MYSTTNSKDMQAPTATTTAGGESRLRNLLKRQRYEDIRLRF